MNSYRESVSQFTANFEHSLHYNSDFMCSEYQINDICIVWLNDKSQYFATKRHQNGSNLISVEYTSLFLPNMFLCSFLQHI